MIQRTGFSGMQHHASNQRAGVLQGISKCADSGRVSRVHLAPRLDFQRDEVAVLFEDEVHFVALPVTPEVQSPPMRFQGAPRLQGLKQGLFQLTDC
jgi:hypothetical protein